MSEENEAARLEARSGVDALTPRIMRRSRRGAPAPTGVRGDLAVRAVEKP
jgi:hypothetical protein